MQLTQNKISNDFWEERANKVLSHFNYKYPDEIDIYDICWRYGIIIKPLDCNYTDDVDYDSIKHLKAFSIPKKKGRRGIIYIQPDLDAIEKKLLLAEEFCHIYSHHSNQLYMDKHYINKIENQAKRMSAYLLMPKRFLKDVFTDAEEVPVTISDIADYFVVTDSFAHYRLELMFNRKVDAILTIKGKMGTLEMWE